MPYRAYGLLAAALRRLTPPERRGWVEGMLAELNHMDGRDRAPWLAGAALAALRMRLAHGPTLHACGLPAAAAALVWTDWRADSDMATLAVLGLSGVLLGMLRPARFGATAAGLGGCLGLTHWASDATGVAPPPYQFSPLSAADGVILVSLLLPAAVAVCTGAILARALAPRRA